MHTGIPVEVRITASSVVEKMRLEVAFAEENLASTRLGSASENPRSILMRKTAEDWGILYVVVEGGDNRAPCHTHGP
jgi:hypothetical protein